MFENSSRRVGIIAVNNTGYVGAMLDCIKANNVAVPLRNIDDQYRINAANVTRIITPTEDGSWMRERFTPSNESEPAIISFTSGTEGSPKGVILTHNNLADVITRLNYLMQLDDSISEYIGVPVYHSFGFGRCRAVATIGGRFFIPRNGFNPSEISEMLRKGEINAISAVPSLWRVLLANKDVIGSYGKKVRWIEIGSQYMSRQEKEAMKALFPEARIVQHYGLTEASRTTLFQINEVEGDILESVGQALGNVKVQITTEGQIAILGNHVAHSYLIDGKEVALQDDDGWFLTKDLGSMENGYLYYKGRADDVINCSGVKVNPEALETKVYASIGCRSGLAICRKPDLMRGDGFLIGVTKELNVDKQKLQQAVLHALEDEGVNAGNAITIVDVDTLPKTATGKIQRKKLTEWYALHSSDEDQLVNATNNISNDNDSIQAIFRRMLNVNKIHPHDSFITLGGDSLSYIQLSIQLERYLGSLPENWESMTLNELERLVPQQKRNATIETDVFLRALAICAIVLNHTSIPDAISEKYIMGSSLLLLALSGFNFARFQGHCLLKGKLIEPTILFLRKLIIPYITIIAIYQIIGKNKIHFSAFLMLNNFVNPMHESVNAFPFPLWFICLLVQTVIIFSCLFSFKHVRNLANFSPWLFGSILLIINLCASMFVMHYWYPNELYYPRLPQVLFWLFVLGWCVHFAKSRFQKLVTTGILLIAMFIMLLNGIVTTEKLWILLGGVMLLWVPFTPVPLFARSVIRIIASATFYIYLSNFALIILVRKLGIMNPLVEFSVGLLGGLLIWFLTQRLPIGKLVTISPLRI